VTTIEILTRKDLIQPPKHVLVGMQYETIVGSIAYGVANTNDKEIISDIDIYGFCIPFKDMVFPHLRGIIPGFGRQIQSFEQYQKHHINDIIEKKTYDLTIYSIIKYFQLCMENNPNMIDSLFTPPRCVLYSSPIAQLVREHRRDFLHKGSWFKFKGYSYAQLHKLKNKLINQFIELCHKYKISPETTLETFDAEIKYRNSDKKIQYTPVLQNISLEILLQMRKLLKQCTAGKGTISKRIKLIEKYGYDCYSEDTEFLTHRGWKKFDNIQTTDLIGAVDLQGNIKFEKPIAKIDKKYTGNMYIIESYMSRCIITENHAMLVSPVNEISSKYPEKSNWALIPFKNLKKEYRSNFYIKQCVNKTVNNYPVEDNYLRLAGLYLSGGSIFKKQIKTGQIINVARITQTKNTKKFLSCIKQIQKNFKLNSLYKKETIWTTDKNTADRLCLDFGQSNKKKLPNWCFQLSYKQAKLFWDSLLLGDGTPSSNIYYTPNKQLADDIQAMMTSAGHECLIKGPFKMNKCLSYQIYRPMRRKQHVCINFEKILEVDKILKKKEGWPIKTISVTNARVVCFEMPSGTLITRNQGKIAIQGNCKFAYHIVRLLNEVEQILIEGDLDLERNREQLKSIRRGDWKLKEIEEYFKRKEAELEKIYAKSKLRHSPDEASLKRLLLNCLEMHFGSLDKVIMKPNETTNLINDIENVLSKYRNYP